MELAYALSCLPKLVITDGAGTLFDPGSVVPAHAFQSVFADFGIEVPWQVIMKYMGREKREHINLILKEPGVLDVFVKFYGRQPASSDVERLYASFKDGLYRSASRTEEIAGVREAAYKLKERKIPLAMTTGYDRRMVEETKKRLPWLDDVLSACFTASDVCSGRPAPFMIYRSMEACGIVNPSFALDVGDTKVDLESSDNAHMPGVLVSSGSVSMSEACSIDEQLDRRHMVFSDLAKVVDHVLDGTIVDRLRALNYRAG